MLWPFFARAKRVAEKGTITWLSNLLSARLLPSHTHIGRIKESKILRATGHARMVITWGQLTHVASREGAHSASKMQSSCWLDKYFGKLTSLPYVVWPAAAERQPRARSARRGCCRENGPQRQAMTSSMLMIRYRLLKIQIRKILRDCCPCYHSRIARRAQHLRCSLVAGNQATLLGAMLTDNRLDKAT